MFVRPRLQDADQWLLMPLVLQFGPSSFGGTSSRLLVANAGAVAAALSFFRCRRRFNA